MNWGNVTRNLKEHVPWIAADVYKGRYGAKYFGFPVVRYLYTSTKVLKMIRLFDRKPLKKP